MSGTKQRLELALAAAQEAGKLILSYFQCEGVVTEKKADASPVTVADRGAEEALRRMIEESFPEDAILGEEFPEKPGSSGFRWILDPLDGTKSFIRGVPLFGTLIAVQAEDEFAIGVIHIPALNECVFAQRGGGAWYRGPDGEVRKARVSSCADLGTATFLTTDVAHFRQIGRADVFARLEEAAGLTRTWGDCYGYLLVATGRAEIMIDPIVNLWDAAALVPVLEEAGGTLTDWEGGQRLDSGRIVATNGLLLHQVLTLTKTSSP